MSLRAKFHLASTCLILIVVFGVMTSLYMSEKKGLSSEIRREQTDDLAKLAKVCEESMIAAADELILINYVKTLLLSPKVSYAGFVDSLGSGWILSRHHEGLVLVDPKDPTVRDVIAFKRLLRRDLVYLNEKVTELSTPVKGRGYVRLGYSDDVVKKIFKQRLGSTFNRLKIVGMVALLFGLVLAHFLGAALTRPIDQLMRAAEAIAKGRKGVKISEAGSDELGRLTKTFNHMSDELEKLDQLKDDFMSHVTHELRSPLTSIIATVELLAEMPLAQKDPKFKRSIDRLVYGSERLNRLVDNILDLTRMEAGKMQFDIQPVDMSALVSEMADFFEPRAMEKRLKIRAIIPPVFPLVNADPERVRQILSNLIYNAIKFTNSGGIALWLRVVDGVAQIGVQDTGVGIPKDKLQSVFEKFECLKDTRNRVDKPVPGSGLGLNIVMNSVKAQGGKIWVESEVDKGSTFIFTLPLAERALQENSAPRDEKPTMVALAAQNGSARRAVLIEDHSEKTEKVV